ncbi:MAG: UDP-N-acetylmuramoyl-tripeptide--D-alanyl-D-alanine ligase [Paludibacteraceae bacterium]|nr:UDP-N-acetylmuramoyl-tripeptide--D-alanyl-D-alanine ligase [Paludibacteraceae bacterium]
MEIEKIYELYQSHPCVTTDTRNCPQDSIFFALKGASFNGNEFAAKSLELGCSYAFVDEPRYADGNRIFLVDNCLTTLQNLARYHREQLGIKIVGITGTNGKTTTKELVSTVLSKKYNTLYTQGNLNNHIGVPLTLLRLNKNHEMAVVEMGANHPGEIKTLVDIVRPDYGLITNVGKAHLEGFGSFEGVIRTKGELYDFLRLHGGMAFLNYDNENLRRISNGLSLFKYGTSSDYDVSAQLIGADPFLSLSWKGHRIDSHLIGAYNFENMMAAIAVGTYFGVAEQDIVDALGEYVPQNNRSQLKETSRNRLIVDAYNANPTSMTASLTNFLGMNCEKKMLILGDMKELGAESRAEHQRIADMLRGQSVHAFLLGPCFMETDTDCPKFASTEEFAQWLKTHTIEGFTILIKGSNSMKLTTLVDLL